MTDTERALEFLSCLNTLELAALLHRHSPEGRVQATCTRLMKKYTDKNLLAVLRVIRNAPSPVTKLAELRIVSEKAAKGVIYL